MKINELPDEIKIPEGTKSIHVVQEPTRATLIFIPEFVEGDFLYSNKEGKDVVFIFKKRSGNRLYFYASKEGSSELCFSATRYHSYKSDFHVATEEKKQKLVQELMNIGKCWNRLWKRIEDYVPPLFKVGNKVKVNQGTFEGVIDTITDVIWYETTHKYGYRTDDDYVFNEEHIDLYSDAPEIGELAIFWETHKDTSVIRIYRQSLGNHHQDDTGRNWKNAIKFESKEQFLNHIKD